MVEVGSVVSAWGDVALLVRHLELCMSQMGLRRNEGGAPAPLVGLSGQQGQVLNVRPQ